MPVNGKVIGAIAPGNARLNARQEIAVRALAEGRSLSATASAAQVNAKTLWRWMHEDVTFIAAVKGANDEAFNAALDELRRVTRKAVATAEALLMPKHEPAVRLAATRVVLGLALRANEQVSFEARLAALEARVSRV